MMLLFIPLLAGAAHAAKDSCFDCHRVMEGTSVVFKNDVHSTTSISCAGCHGGDPKEDDQNVSMNASRGFKLRATRQGIPEYCGNCHSDAGFMGKYKQQPRVDQLARYRTGVHGKLLAAGNKKAAECVDCHGVHNIRAVNDPLSMANPQHVTETCAKCHAATADLFKKSRHGRRFTTGQRPGCVVCHASHDTKPASTAMLTGKNAVCARCHKDGSAGARAAAEIAKQLATLEAAGPGAKDALARARRAVHTLDPAAVKRAAEAPAAPTATPAEKKK
jgi:predicted CXXCH cytochrome family protein